MSRRAACLVALGFAVLCVGIWAGPHLLPVVLRRYRDDIVFSGERGERRLFLTIDDVPSDTTGAILDVLERHGVQATFFVMAGRVASPHDLLAITRRGHRLGNHLRTTQACSTLPLAVFKQDFDTCDALLRAAGAEPTLFRPPSDFGTREQLRYVRERGHTPVLGTVFPLDHWITRPTWLRRLAVWLAVDGGIIILHDGRERGRVTAELLAVWLPELQAAGYVIEPLDPARLRLAAP